MNMFPAVILNLNVLSSVIFWRFSKLSFDLSSSKISCISNTHNLCIASETMLHALREQTYDPPHQNQRLFCETRYSILRYVISRYLCHIIISTFRYSTHRCITVPHSIRIHKIFPIFFHFVCSDHFSILKNIDGISSILWCLLPIAYVAVVLEYQNIKSP